MLGTTAGLAVGWPFRNAHADDGSAQLAPDDAWLLDLSKRKQRAFLDIGGFSRDGTPFRRANALMTMFTTTYGMAQNDVGIAFGAHSGALAYLLSQDFWTEYDLAGKVAGSLRVDDAAALRKAGPSAASIGADGVRELRAKGMRVLACRNTMARWSRDLAEARNLAPDVVLQRLNASLHEGVEPVPAMVGAAVLAQARGMAYVVVA
ncbi:MAG: hypothetical protein ABMA00_03610 [Gemmatimonas sp.]